MSALESIEFFLHSVWEVGGWMAGGERPVEI